LQAPLRGPSNNPEFWQRVAVLVDQREGLERNLPPEKKEALLRYRIGMSQAQYPNQRNDYINLIDELDPNLAAVNKELLGLFAVSGKSKPSQYPRLRNLNSCLDGKTNPKVAFEDQSLVLSSTEMQRGKPYDEQWYAPYAEIHKLASRYSLSLDFEHAGDKVNAKFYVPIDGVKKYLPVDASRDPEKQIKLAIEAKGEELEKRFNMRISKVGQEAMKQVVFDNSGMPVSGDHTLTTRLPDIHELYGIEAAAEESQLSSYGPRLDFYFLSEPTWANGKVAGEYLSELNGNPAVVLQELKDSQGLYDDHFHDILRARAKEVTDHEIVHHEQKLNKFWDNKELIERMGWRQSKDSSQEWLLKGSNGEFFRFMENLFVKEGVYNWLLCNERGEAVNEDKTPVTTGNVTFISNDEVLARAELTPPHWYFRNPCEMHAKGTELFRSSASLRSQFLLASKEIYAAIKDDDQRLLDEKSKELGTSPTIRLPSGKIVERTKETEAIVAEFESSFASRSSLPGLLEDPLKEIKALKNSYASSANSQSTRDRFEALLERIKDSKGDADIAQTQLNALNKNNGEVRVRDDVATRSSTLANYHRLVGETYAHYAAFELMNGNKVKAREYLELAQRSNHTTELNLAGTGFTDEEVAMFGKLEGVKKLDLSGTNITDHAASTIVSLGSVEDLKFDGNKKVTDATLHQLKQLQSLNALHLHNLPAISDLGISHLSRMQTVKHLELVNSSITSDSLMHIAKLKDLHDLKIESINIGDKDLSKLTQLEHLFRLRLLNINMSDTGCQSLAKMTNVGFLELEDPISDAGLKHLKSMTGIMGLSLKSNSFTGRALSSLAELPNLGSLNLEGHGITGGYLQKFSKFPALSTLAMKTNEPIAEEQINSLRQAMPWSSIMIENTGN
jgi:hypothetical protein